VLITSIFDEINSLSLKSDQESFEKCWLKSENIALVRNLEKIWEKVFRLVGEQR